MIVGFGRTSTTDQIAGLDAQIRDLTAAGCERIFSEQVSSVATSRPQFEAAIDFVREGDTLVITKICRAARSVADLSDLVARLQKKGVSLRILAMGIDTATPTGKLMVNLLGSIAQFEREIMLERQREGIRRAALEGKYKGRAPTARAKKADVLRLASEGQSKVQIAASLGISERSVYRVISESAGGHGGAGAA